MRFPTLNRSEQRGSKPRCHLLTDGPDEEVAGRLSRLCAPFATVSATDRWMPRGFEDPRECQLHLPSPILDSPLCRELAAWWLPEGQSGDRTPNFDIAATCMVGGRPGVLLVEAKAHGTELGKESAGRQLKTPGAATAQFARAESHKTIGNAIDAARQGLSSATGLEFRISRDACYQMSNRFAWSWKLADSGIPVVLVYLGFLDASEMADQGSPFRSHDEWRSLVIGHGGGIVPAEIWEQAWNINGQTFVPLVRSLALPLTPVVSSNHGLTP